MEQNDIKINLHSIGTKAQTCIYIYIYIHGELEIQKYRQLRTFRTVSKMQQKNVK